MFGVPFRCERSISINKHISEVRPVIGDFHTWMHWSPWLCMEKGCVPKIEGGVNSIGHGQAWEGDRIGSGSMVMTDKSENSYKYDMQIFKPWKSKSKVEFKFEGQGGETKVTWIMNGSLPIFMAFLKKMMKTWVESDYDRGLMMLKDYLETGPVISDSDVTGLQEKTGFYYLGIRKSTTLDDMPTVMSRDFGQMMEWVEVQKLPAPRDYIAIYQKYDMVKNRCDFTSALVYDEKPDNAMGLKSGQVGDHLSVQVIHTGPYKYLGNAWSAVMAEQRSKKLKINKKVPWYEVYLNSPTEVTPEELQTEINIPVRPLKA